MNRKMNKLALAVLVVCSTGFVASAVEFGKEANNNLKTEAVTRALGHLNTKSSAGSSVLAGNFMARDVIIDQDGAQHVRFDRSIDGLRVIGGDMVVHSDASGAFASLSHGADLSQDVSNAINMRAPSISISVNAEKLALQQAQGLFHGVNATAATAEHVYYARDREPTLAFDVQVSGMSLDGTPSKMHYIVDASTNTLLDSFDEIRTVMSRDGKINTRMMAGLQRAQNRSNAFAPDASDIDAAFDSGASPFATSVNGKTGQSVEAIAIQAASAGTGKSLVSGTVALTTDSISGGYALRDPSRGSHYATNLANRTSGNGTLFTDADNVWGNFLTSSTVTAAVDAVYGQNLTWDFYKNVLGRNGIANDGRGAFSRIHYGRNYVNAFWSDACFCMTYGDGDGTTYLPLVAIDVAGHEMTHGVTARSANLTYSGESGGLNEAISDMFGTSVEFYANSAINPPNYLIGERIFKANNGVATPTSALRFMFKPSLDGASPDCYSSTIGSLDVHYSSGVANHFFFLLSEGATSQAGFSTTPAQMVCNGNTALAGVGRTAAIKIVYRALTVYMTSSTNYKGARTAMLSAATDLYGSTSTQRNAVAAAWSAVGVN